MIVVLCAFLVLFFYSSSFTRLAINKEKKYNNNNNKKNRHLSMRPQPKERKGEYRRRMRVRHKCMKIVQTWRKELLKIAGSRTCRRCESTVDLKNKKYNNSKRANEQRNSLTWKAFDTNNQSH